MLRIRLNAWALRAGLGLACASPEPVPKRSAAPLDPPSMVVTLPHATSCPRIVQTVDGRHVGVE